MNLFIKSALISWSGTDLDCSLKKKKKKKKKRCIYSMANSPGKIFSKGGTGCKHFSFSSGEHIGHNAHKNQEDGGVMRWVL